MSSRALRRLQADSGLEEIGVPGLASDSLDDSQEENEPVQQVSIKKKKKKAAVVNPFELLNEDKDDAEEVGEEEEETGLDENNKVEVKEQTKPSSRKKKKKGKKKGKDIPQEEVVSKENDEEDEIEASVQAVNRLLGEPSPAIAQTEDFDVTLKLKPLLHIDYRSLNPENEMRRMFGSELFRGEPQQRNRRQRNRPVMRSSKLVQPKDTWHSTRGCGLSMKFLGEKEGFLFEHSPAYQKLEHQLLDGIESGLPQAVFSTLQENPYHIDTLISLADFYTMNEDFQTGAECIEKALYGMECAFHSMFNIAAGNCYMDYKLRENRCLYICLFKHIVNLGQKGCCRTALEFCKVLLSLDPTNDPLNCLSMIDYYALRSEQYDYLIRLEAEVSYSTSQLQTPNFAFSIPLAYYKMALKDGGDTQKADEMLQDRLLLYPMMLLPILDKCSVMPDKRVENHKFFSIAKLDDRSNELKRLISLYATRCETCWKEPVVMSWLEKNVHVVLDIVEKGEDPRIEEYARRRQQQFKHPPPSIIRHYYLSGIPIPSHITTRTMYAHDPYPPSDSIAGYERPPRAPRSATSDRGIMRLLLESLLPSYNPNALPTDHGPNQEEGAEGGARAIPQQLQQSVNAIMDAMRNLLNHVPAPQEEGVEVDEENEREWEEEEDDYHNQQH